MNSDITVEALFNSNSVEDELSVNISKPENNSVYVKGNELSLKPSKIGIPLIIGKLNIEVNVENAVGDITYEFYIDDELIETKTTVESSCEFVWNERAFFRRTVTVKACDESLTNVEDTIDIMIFNFGLN